VPSRSFDAYSAYYDLLYRDKDYAGEAGYIDGLIREHAGGGKKLLDLGCGTGAHDWQFAEKGYQVTGVDRSPSMLERARQREANWPRVGHKPDFLVGDLTDFKTSEKYDVVVSLFDVVSYLTSYADLRAALTNITACLKPGGLLIFDCWYGPAVYTQKPETRVRRLEDEHIDLTRIATADFDHIHNRIDVHYEMFVRRKADDNIETFTETHPMRCYFSDEINDICAPFGFEQKFAVEWFTRAAPSTRTWSVLFGMRLPGSAS